MILILEMNDPNANPNQHPPPPPQVPIHFPIQGGLFAQNFNQPVPQWVQQLIANQQTLLLQQQQIIQNLLARLNQDEQQDED